MTTGYLTLCGVYKRSYDPAGKQNQSLVLYRIDVNTLNQLLGFLSAHSDPSNFVTPDGLVILHALKQYNDDPATVYARITHANFSRSKVFYVQFLKKNFTVNISEYDLAIKINLVKDSFTKEKHILDQIKGKLSADVFKDFYYESSSGPFPTAIVPDVTDAPKNWFDFPSLPAVNGGGGAIFMKPAVNPTSRFKYSSKMDEHVKRWLEHIHAAGVLHNDIRRSNILYFGEKLGYQLVDFDLACKSGDPITIQKDSAQHTSSGDRVLKTVNDSSEDCVKIYPEFSDDLAMFEKTCIEMGKMSTYR
jgi:serine/threonine protein kinase